MTEWIWATGTSQQRQTDNKPLRVSFGESLKQTLYQEQANWFLWLPVALALGSGSYFALVVEPSWGFVTAFMLSTIGLIFVVRKHTLALVFSVFILSVSAGFTLAKLNTFRVAAPVIQKRIGPVTVAGRIEALLFLANGEIKIIIQPSRIERLKAEDIPGRIRLKLRKSQTTTELFPGLFIEARAIIFPPPEPTHPDGFDFARKNWFEGIGGSGFFISTPKVIAFQGQASFLEQAKTLLALLRQNISSRLKSQLDGEKGGLAAALIVGDRAAISKTMINTLRDAGLAHYVPFWTRYCEPLVRTREVLESGLLGDIRGVVYRWHNPRPDDRRSARCSHEPSSLPTRFDGVAGRIPNALPTPLKHHSLCT